MDLRIRGLDHLDPLAVPLPVGTEVTTRVDRVAGERRVPQGALGRVAANDADGDELEVDVVGVGRLRYRRDELLPRRLGLARFARRRAAAWEALAGTVVLEATVGSHAWGLAGPDSDVDRRGVFVLPFAWTSGLEPPPDTLVSDDGNATYWEVGKAVRQALAADPNTLELLFVSSVRSRDPLGAWLLAARDAFPSIEIYGSFGRYALSQLHRLRRARRLFAHRDAVLGWLRAEPAPSLDQVAARLAAADGGSGDDRDGVLQAKEYLKQLYRSMHDRGLLEAQSFAALVAFARRGEEPPELPRELRPKNAYNLVRLIATAIGWLRHGVPDFEAHGILRDRLLAIKHGELSLEQVIALAETMTPELEQARACSPLPRSPDLARADAVLRRIRAEAARRFVEQVPGALGRDAVPPPPLRAEPEAE